MVDELVDDVVELDDVVRLDVEVVDVVEVDDVELVDVVAVVELVATLTTHCIDIIQLIRDTTYRTLKLSSLMYWSSMSKSLPLLQMEE